jgi:hypothetical protein
MSDFKIKRDITTSNPPAADQLEVGELVMNATTGILYSKLTNGLIIKWLPVFASSSTVPVITFSDFSTFCCTGDTLTTTVSNLTVGESYTYEFVDLNNNNVIFTGESTGSLLPTTDTSRSISVILELNGPENVTLIKFIVKLNNVVLAENIASICCGICS